MSGSHPSGQAAEPRTLVVGVGNLLLGDDGFGVHVIRRLLEETLPERVDLEDGGTGGVDLLEMLSAYDRAIVIDLLRVLPPEPVAPAGAGDRETEATGGLASARASVRAPVPGEVVVFRPNRVELHDPDPRLSLHGGTLGGCLRLAAILDIEMPDIVVVGLVGDGECAPGLELSETARRGVETAVARIRDILAGEAVPV